MENTQTIIQEAKDEFKKTVDENLKDLEIHEWTDGGKFSEIRDIDYCTSNILDVFETLITNTLKARDDDVRDLLTKLYHESNDPDYRIAITSIVVALNNKTHMSNKQYKIHNSGSGAMGTTAPKTKLHVTFNQQDSIGWSKASNLNAIIGENQQEKIQKGAKDFAERFKPVMKELANEEQTMEERFRKVGNGSVRFMSTREEVLNFIKKEKQLSYKQAIQDCKECVPEEMELNKKEEDADWYYGLGCNHFRKELLEKFNELK